MKFDFSKSVDTDFRNKLQSDLHSIMTNVTYLSYQVDTILKIVKQQQVDKGLQKQVDEYFDETSPQTDSGEQK